MEPRALSPQDGAASKSASTATSGSSTSALCAPGPGQRCVDQGSDTNPGLAAETYAAVKAAKYADQDHFIPFILETGGHVTKRPASGSTLLPPSSQAKRRPAKTTTTLGTRTGAHDYRAPKNEWRSSNARRIG